jgi:hypothetical protein
MSYTARIGTALVVATVATAAAAVTTLAVHSLSGQSVSPRADGTPICELVATHGTLLGDRGPFGKCFNNTLGLPVNCVTTAPSVGTFITVDAEVCVPD